MLTAETPETSAPAVDTGGRWLAATLIIVSGLFVAILDVTIVNVAVPAIQYDFGGTLEDVLWIATAYTLTLGVVVPLSSWLGDRVGLTKLFIGALLGFAAGSGLCGLAWDLDSMIAFRIIQAIPGGILPVASLTMLYRLVPKERISLAMGLYGLGAVAAPAVGPVLGGYLVEHVDWRLVFYINVPIATLTALAAIFFIPDIPRVPVHRFDFAGFGTVSAAMFAILLAASKGEEWGWGGYRILILLVAGALFLALFTVIELEVEHPLLELRLLANRQYAFTAVCTGVFFLNLLVGVFYVPVFLQQVQGLPAFDAGLVTLPSALVMCVTIPLSGLLYDRLGAPLLGGLGVALMALGSLLSADMTPATSHADIILWTSIRGLGIGIGTIPIMTWGLSRVPLDRTNHASAIQNVMQQVGGALGLAALGTMIAAHHAQLTADRSALLQPDSQLGRLAGPLLHQTTDFTATSFALAYRLGTTLQLQTLSTAYGNMYLVVAASTFVLLLMVVTMRERRPAVTPAATPVAVPVAVEPAADPIPVPTRTGRSVPAPVRVALRRTIPAQERVLMVWRQSLPMQERVLTVWLEAALPKQLPKQERVRAVARRALPGQERVLDAWTQAIPRQRSGRPEDEPAPVG